MAQRRYITWIDANGFTRLTLLNSLAGCSGVQTQMLALSEADTLNYLDTALTVNSAPSPPGGRYRGVEDVAALSYTDGVNLVVIQLPAPPASIFLADTVTVDAAAVAALTAAVIGVIITSGGAAVTGYVGGVRRRGVTERYSQ